LLSLRGWSSLDVAPIVSNKIDNIQTTSSFGVALQSCKEKLFLKSIQALSMGTFRLIILWLVALWGFPTGHKSGVLAQETRPGAGRTKYSTGCDKNDGRTCFQGPQPRIVGGSSTDEGRYPYFVSLLNQYGIHSCGGTLVAPDVVMSAAHCADSVKYAQVGRWNRVQSDDDYEEFDIVMPLHLHPLYVSETSFSHDVMLIKLNRQSTKEYLTINEDPNLPTQEQQQPDELTALGIGYTQHANASSAPPILQEASLTYVPNYICERSKDPSVVENYQGLISEDMLCASDHGEDACQGEAPVALQCFFWLWKVYSMRVWSCIDLIVGLDKHLTDAIFFTIVVGVVVGQ
jgi:hypothetical protein